MSDDNERYAVKKSEADWQKELDPLQHHVLRNHGTERPFTSPLNDEKRRGLNAFVRESGLFDGVVDFDAATLDPASGGLRPEMVPESTTGGKGDRLHPNRAGYLAMGSGIDLGVVLRGR